MNNIKGLPPFKRLCVTIGNLPSSYVDSMSYYECLMWLCKYLQETVVPTVNENAEAVNELINWFNTLDVQDEIDHKLDEMVESGELQAIIEQYLEFNTSRIFENVAGMVTADLLEDQYVQTLGYYSTNDGGASLYKIVDDDSLVVDNAFVIALTNGLKALLIHNDTEIIAEKLGFKADDEFDNGVVFRKIMSDNNTIETPVTLLFGSKTYRFTPTLIYGNTKFYIKGKTNDNLGSYERTTFFKPYQDNQRYVIKIGGDATFSVPENWHTFWKTNYSIEGITFSDDDHPLQAPASPNAEKYGLLCIEYFSGILLDVCFHDCKSRCIYEKNCWELHYKYLSLTGISCPVTSSCLYIDDCLADGYSNTSAHYFDFINAESINAPILRASGGANMVNWFIDKISLENFNRTSDDILGKPIANITDKATFESCTPFGILEINSPVYGLQIGEVNLHGVGNKYFYIDNNNTKGVDVLLKLNSRFSVNIDSVNYNVCGAFSKIFGSSNSADTFIESVLTINSMIYQPTVVPNNPVSLGTNMLGYIYINLAGGLVDIKSTNMTKSTADLYPVAPKLYREMDIKEIASNLYGRVRFGRGSISNNAILAQYGSEVFSRDLYIHYPCKILIGIKPKARNNANARVGLYYRTVENVYGGSLTASIGENDIDKNKVYTLTLTSELIATYNKIQLLVGDATYHSIDFIEIIPT